MHVLFSSRTSVVFFQFIYFQISYANWYEANGRETFSQFMKDVIERTAEPPWNDDSAKQNNIPVRINGKLPLEYNIKIRIAFCSCINRQSFTRYIRKRSIKTDNSYMTMACKETP